jgi:hypothetical protein
MMGEPDGEDLAARSRWRDESGTSVVWRLFLSSLGCPVFCEDIW